MPNDIALGELFRIGSSKRVLKSQWQEKGVPFYRGREVTRLAKDGFVNNELYISEELYSDYADKYGVPTSGDIVITAIGTIGNSYIVCDGDRFYFKDASVLWLKKTSEVSSEFINLWLKSPVFWGQLDKGNGATVDTLTIKKLQSVALNLPPVKEQKRIASILDEAFAGISQAVANAEKNLANARELFDSYLNNVFTQKGEGWIDTTVSDLVDNNLISKPLDGNHGDIHPKKADFVDKGVPFIMASDLINGEVDQLGCNFISREQGDGLRKGFAKDSDVLLSHKGTIGRVAVLNTQHDYVMLTPQVTYYRIIDHTVLNNRYLYYFFQSPSFQKEIGDIAGIGSTRAYIGITKQLGLAISYPLLKEQMRLSEIFDELVIKTQHLENVYQQKLTALTELKQSILQKAFTGELTAEIELQQANG